MPVIKLKEIAEALNESMDEWEQFINIKTGKIISVPESPWTAGQDIYDELNAELEEAEDDFRMLPNQYEIREYNIMMDFALESGNDVVEAKLTRELHRTHPYRHFKDAIYDMGIEQLYYDYRSKAFLEKAREWCESHGLEYEE